jgi:hypothetical protein
MAGASMAEPAQDHRRETPAPAPPYPLRYLSAAITFDRIAS